MINPLELRIGNNVLSGGEISVPCVVRIINVDEENTYYPILLTPEVLEKCAFVFSFREATWFKNYAWLAPSEEAHNGVSDCLCFHSSEGMQIGEDFTVVSCAEDGFSASCKYLHQLQNLYYSLTGSELIYKP